MPRREAPQRVAVAAFPLVCTVAVAVAVAACGHSTPVVAQTRDASSPDAAVRAYYGALSLHQFAVADGYLAPGVQVLQRSFTDSPANNLLSLAQLRVDSSRVVGADSLPGLPDGVSPGDYDTFAQVTVDYVATFRRVISEPDGRLTRFIYLGRLKRDQKWQILAIGSGP